MKMCPTCNFDLGRDDGSCSNVYCRRYVSSEDWLQVQDETTEEVPVPDADAAPDEE